MATDLWPEEGKGSGLSPRMAGLYISPETRSRFPGTVDLKVDGS